MIAAGPIDDSLQTLLDAACCDELTEEQFNRLEAALAASAEARRAYLRYFTLTGELRYLVSMKHADDVSRQRTGMAGAAEGRCGDVPAVEPGAPLFSAFWSNRTFQGPAECMTPDWTRAYLMSAAVLGLFLLVASFINFTHDSSRDHDSTHANSNSRGSTASGAAPFQRPEMVFVGRVSGMVDCQWSDPKTETVAGAGVALNRRYALKSGLMELTYQSGAKVILQGPCDYTVESARGGFLQVGKLVALVPSGQWPVASGQKAEAGTGKASGTHASAKPQAELYPLSTTHYPLFAVRTPTTTITDLGTEFGVEVDGRGATVSYVFQGLVRVKMLRAESGRQEEVVLNCNESARVEPSAQKITVFSATATGESTARSKFVRSLKSNYVRAVLADKPVFYWTFNEPSGPAFEQARHLSRQALLPLGAASRCSHEDIGSGLALGNAADFTGGSGAFASRQLHQGVVLPGPWAVEFWIQPPLEQKEHRGQYVLNVGLGSEPPFNRTDPAIIFNWPQHAAGYELQLFREGHGATSQGPLLVDQRWRHVIFVFFGNGDFFGVADRVDVVLDGQARTIDRKMFTAAFRVNGQLWLGTEGADFRHPFRGRIDELAVYDLSGLTEQQVGERAAELGRRHFSAAHTKPVGNSLPRTHEQKGGD
jgi:hypothetical protein